MNPKDVDPLPALNSSSPRGRSSTATSVTSYASASLTLNVLGIVVLGYAARVLTLDEMGLVVAFRVVITFAFVLSEVGFGQGLIRLLSGTSQSEVRKPEIVGAGIAIRTALAGLGAVVLLLFSSLLGESLGSETAVVLFRLLAIDVVLNPITGALENALIGLERIPLQSSLRLISNALGSAVTVALLFYGYGPLSLVIGYVAIDSAQCLGGIASLHKMKALAKPSLSDVRWTTSRLMALSGPLAITNIAGLFLGQFDRVFILALFALSQAAKYGVASTIYTSIVVVVASAIGTVAFPRFSAAYDLGFQQLRSSVMMTLRLSSIVMFPLLFSLVSVSSEIITIIVGPSYSDAILPFVVFVGFALLRPLWVSVSGVPVILRVAGKQAVIGLGAMLTELLLAVALIPIMSIALLAAVSSVSSSVIIVGTWILVNRRLCVPLEWKLPLRLALLGGIQMIVSVTATGLAWSIATGLTIKVLGSVVVYLIGFRAMSIIRPRDLDDMNVLTGGRVLRLLGFAAKVLGVNWKKPSTVVPSSAASNTSQ